jgi:uncharacterized protein (DUF2141 family)
MKKTIVTFCLICTTLTLQARSELYTLTVQTKRLQNNKGEVQFSLYNKTGTIPDKMLNKYFKKKRVKIINGKAEVTFTELPKGRYAVSVYHDENNNHKIDKGFIMPTEAVGLSNFKNINFLHLPNFEDASFPLTQNGDVKIHMIYF